MVGSAYGFEAKQSEFLLPYSQEATPQEFRLATKLSAKQNTCRQNHLGLKQMCVVSKKSL